MTDTKKPADPETGCAPLNRPMAETVSLDLVWAAAYAAAYVREEPTVNGAVKVADGAVAYLLAVRPRGGR